jgi:hypothetical protein
MIPPNKTSFERSFSPLRFNTLICPNRFEMLKRLHRQVSAKAFAPTAENRINGRYRLFRINNVYLKLVKRIETLNIILKLIFPM